jgi:cysteinyl-tRNA synthetase
VLKKCSTRVIKQPKNSSKKKAGNPLPEFVNFALSNQKSIGEIMSTKKNLYIYNTLSRKKELFEPLRPPFVGLYVCGPTVYGDAHLGHARPAITFDLVFRYLLHLEYKVRYVRNITDVGHLENDEHELGEDKIAKKARLEQLEPMEVVQYYTDRYHEDMDRLNIKKPSIEPRASGHIIEQIELTKKILESGFAYEVNGSVYFDVEKYNKKHRYGKLSGRVIDDMIANTRNLDGQEEKRSNVDFALWKKAAPSHIMRWPSPWSEGFPGWHLECSAMSSKYLGEVFDIHGGGMDLLFPHHECEIAQSNAAQGKDAVNLWMHNNMITINGQKMGKSLGNFITLRQFFSGDHDSLEKTYSPMTIRFFILQAHYRSTLDFSNEALIAAEKGLKRLLQATDTLNSLKPADKSSVDLKNLEAECYNALNDDFNSPVALAHLFDAVRIINSVHDGKDKLNKKDLETLKRVFSIFVDEIFGLKSEIVSENKQTETLLHGIMKLLLDIRQKAKEQKDYSTSDNIRDQLASLKIAIKDSKDGSTWELKE